MAAVSIPLVAADHAQSHLRRRPLLWGLAVRYVLPRAFMLWLATRLMNVALTVLFVHGPASHQLSTWLFYDAIWYRRIAFSGYVTVKPWLAPFFPLYPLLLAPFTHLPGQWPLIAELFVSNLTFLAALICVGLLTAHEVRQRRVTFLAMALLVFSPLAVFLAGIYSDSLFIALVALALLTARRGHWRWASLTLGLAVITRPFGLLLIPVLLTIYGSEHDWRAHIRQRRVPPVTRDMLLIVMAPAMTFGAYLFVLTQAYGDPFMFLHVEGVASASGFGWGHGLRWPWDTLLLVGHQFAVLPSATWARAHLLVDVLPVMGCLALALLARRRVPLAFTALTLGVVMICLVTPRVGNTFPDPMVSDGRYCYAAAPVLLPQCAAWLSAHSRNLRAVVIISAIALQAILTIFVLRGGWLV